MLLTILSKLFLGVSILLILLLPITVLAAEQQLTYDQQVFAEYWYENGNEDEIIGSGLSCIKN